MLKSIFNLYKRPVTIKNVLLAIVLDLFIGFIFGIMLSLIFNSPVGGSIGVYVAALLILVTIAYFFTLRVIDSFKRQ